MKKISKMKSSKLGSTTSHVTTLSNGSLSSRGITMSSSTKSNGSSMSNSNGTSTDETNQRIIRDLSHIDGNRYCFECGQRGPMYVDVTIGSFVCMTCSGLIRGLTPPHRVKSISMATFSNEEVELLKSRGNEYCKKVWMSTYNGKEYASITGSDSDRLNSLKSLMSAKYEQKRYYVDPMRLPRAEIAEIQGKTIRALTIGQASSASPTSTHSSPSPLLSTTRTTSSPTISQQSKSRLSSSMTLPDIKPLSHLLNGTTSSIQDDLSTLKISNGHAMTSSNETFQLGPWSTLNGSETTSSSSTTTNSVCEFADFEHAFSNNNGNSQAFKAFKNEITSPSSTIHPGLIGTKTDEPLAFSNGPDKYAALKDLDSLFKQGNGDSQINGISNSVSVPTNLSSVNKEIDWFNTSISPKSSTQNPFTSSCQPQNQPQQNGWNHLGAVSNNNNPFYSGASPPVQNGIGSSLFSPKDESSFMAQSKSQTPYNPFFQQSPQIVQNSTNPFL